MALVTVGYGLVINGQWSYNELNIVYNRQYININALNQHAGD